MTKVLVQNIYTAVGELYEFDSFGLSLLRRRNFHISNVHNGYCTSNVFSSLEEKGDRFGGARGIVLEVSRDVVRVCGVCVQENTYNKQLPARTGVTHRSNKFEPNRKHQKT